MAVEIEVELKDEVSKALLAVIRAGKRLRPVLVNFGEHMLTSIQENFVQEGRPKKWKPSLRALREHGQTLRDSGILVSSIHPKVSPDGSILRVGSHPRVGTNIEYAAIHQFGGFAKIKGKKVKIPARPFLLIHAEDEDFLVQEASDYLTDAWEEA